MYSINSTISKKELLEYLKSHAYEDGPLYIGVETLPSFLNTPVAFTIFAYQITNYPRKIIWVTSDDRSFDLISQTSSHVLKEESKVSNNDPIQSTSNKDQPLNKVQKKSLDNLRLRSVTLSSSTSQKDFQEEKEESSDINPTKKTETILVPDEKRITNNVNQLYNQNDKSDTNNEEKPLVIAAQQGFSVKSLLKQQQFTSSPILEQDSDIKQVEKSEPSDTKQQNFDSWLDRINATKEALQSLRTTPQTSFLEKFEVYENQKSRKQKKRGLVTIGGILAAFFLIAGIVILFPTQVYTLSVRPIQVEDTASLEIPLTEFGTRTVRLTDESETAPSGQQEIITERSSGRVSLINPGSGNVRLDNGMFRLESNGRVYEALINSTLPSSFSIPARNDLNGPAIEVTIQARQGGAEFNVNEGERFEIINFLNQKVCDRCYAIAITPIQNTQISGNKIVSDADYSLLRATSEGNIAQRRLEEIQNIQDERIFTNPNWYRNVNSDYTFSHPLGANTDIVKANVEISTTIYFLSQDLIELKLKSNNPNIDSINRLALLEFSGDIASNETLTLKFYYRYDQSSEISEGAVASSISQKSCDEARTQLIEDYPTIDYVDCRKLGFEIPGVPHRVDVKIINNSSSSN